MIHAFLISAQNVVNALLTVNEVHGVVEPNVSYVTNAVLDDGTGTMRAVFWETANKPIVQ